MFKPEQKTIFISRSNQQAETIYLVEDKDISDYLEYERSLGNGTVQVLCKNVLVFNPEDFFAALESTKYPKNPINKALASEVKAATIAEIIADQSLVFFESSAII